MNDPKGRGTTKGYWVAGRVLSSRDCGERYGLHFVIRMTQRDSRAPNRE